MTEACRQAKDTYNGTVMTPPMTTDARRARALAQIALVLGVLIIPLVVGPMAHGQQNSGVSITAGFAFDGYCQEDTWCPLIVVLTNEGNDIEGELRIQPVGSAAEGALTYVRPIQLPAHSRKAYILYVPPSSSYVYPSRYLTVRLMSGREEIAADAVRANRYLDPADRLYGVVSNTPSALDFLGDVPPPAGDAAVAQIGLEALPPDPLGWEALDVLILNDVDTTTLSSEQRQALMTWLAYGGHLIVGGGSGAARTSAGLSDLLPVTVGSLRSVNTLSGLRERAAATALAGPYLLAESTLVAGEVLGEQNGLILIARRQIGAGTVDFLAFDAGLDPFARPADLTHLWASLMETNSPQHNVVHVSDTYAANEAVGTIPELRLPSLLQIVGFLLAYIVLIGPVNYLVLRRLDRRELAWATIPALIVAFTVLAYLTGFQLRGRSPILHRLAVVMMPEVGDRARVSGLVGLFSPWRTRYDVQAHNANIRSLNLESLYTSADPRPLSVVEEADASTVVGLSVDIGQVRPFQAEGYVPMERPQSDLRFVTANNGLLAIDGTIQNGPIPLRQARLVVGSRERALGDLEAGQTVTLSQSIPAARLFLSGSSYYPFYSSGTITPEEYRSDYLTSAFFNGVATLGTGIYLVGWSDRSPLDIQLEGQTAATSDLTLYIFALPVAPRQASPGSPTTAIIPAWAISRQVEVYPSYYYGMPADQIYIAPGQPTVLRFNILPQAMVSQVDRLTLTLRLSSGYGVSLRPDVQLYNWTTHGWESVEITQNSSDIPNPSAYVSPSGVVRVRLSASSETWLSEVSIRIDGQY